MKRRRMMMWRMATLAMVAMVVITGCSRQKRETAPNDMPLEAPAKRPVLIEPNGGVDKVRKGMSEPQVAAALGRPNSKNGRAWIYSGRGMYVMFGDDGVMFNVKCVPPFAGVTKEGIGLGSTRGELIQAYGKPDQDQHFQQGDENLWFAPLRASFYLENDKITSFIVHLDGRSG